MGYGQTSSASASMHAGAGPGAGSSFFNNGGGGGGGSGAASIHGHPHHNRTQLYSGDSHVGLGHLHGHHVSHAHGSSSPLTSSHLYSSPYGHGHAGFNQSDIWGAPRHLPTKSSASLQYPHHISRFSDDTQSIHRIPGEAYYTIGNGPSTSSANANNSASAATSQINLGGSTEDGTYRSLRHHSSFVNRAQSQSLDFGGAAAAAGGGPYSMGGTHPITRNGSTSSGPGVSRGHGHGGLPPGSSSSSLYHMHYGGGGGGSSGHAMHGNNNSIGGAGSSDAHYNPMASPSITGHSTMDLASPGPRAERLPSTGPVSGLHHSVHGSSQSLSRIAQAQAAHANAQAQAQAQAHLQAQAQVYAHAQAQAHAQAAQAHAAALGGQVWGAESPSMDEVTRLLASIQQ
ncbi:unnamed protein product [Tilletia laevis]|uniref:Uncharacterized protein n=3 Tax=Tilletia TaxID=13289 RepID=A0A9N8QBH4_9BASI|nr:unnamed protein product [Tilletia laevis]